MLFIYFDGKQYSLVNENAWNEEIEIHTSSYYGTAVFMTIIQFVFFIFSGKTANGKVDVSNSM